MNRRVTRSLAVIGLVVMAGAPSAMAQTKNPCAAKNPGAVKGANPCAARNPCTAKNPCAAKYPMGGPGLTGWSQGSTGVYVPGQGTREGRLKSIELR